MGVGATAPRAMRASATCWPSTARPAAAFTIDKVSALRRPMRRKLAVKSSRKGTMISVRISPGCNTVRRGPRKNCSMGTSRSLALRLQTKLAPEHQQRRRAVKRGHGRAQIAADGGQVASLHRAYLERGFGDGRQSSAESPDAQQRAAKVTSGADSGLVLGQRRCDPSRASAKSTR